MSAILYDLSTKIEPAIAAVIRNVDVAATALGIEYFLCGAMARDFVVEHIYGMASRRATQDLDFGISIQSWEEFEDLKTQLIRLPSYSQDTKMEQRIRAGGLWFDMVPFGAIEDRNGKIFFPPSADFELNVAGFRDAFASAIMVLVAPGLSVRVASLPGLVLLKLLAWNERGGLTNKDATDIRSILCCCAGEWNADRIYADAALLEAESYEPERVGARLLGRDMGSVLQASTRAQIIAILEEQSALGRNAYPLVDQMLGGLILMDRTESEVEKQIELLRCLRRGMDEAILLSP